VLAKQRPLPWRHLSSLSQAVWHAQLRWHHAQFTRAAAAPRATQERKLKELLARARDTEYGRAHGFAALDSLEAYQARVPVVDYDALAPWIAQVADGERHVLTRQSVLALHRTPGHAGTPKLLPVTAGLVDEVTHATQAWLATWLRHAPELLRRPMYWFIPPARRGPGTTHGGVPLASHDPTTHLGWLSKAGLRASLAVPPVVASMANAARWRRTTLYNLLACDDLGSMVAGHAGHLLELMAALEEDLPDLLGRLPAARADTIRAGLDAEGRVTSRALWPKLQAVACWSDGAAAATSGLLPQRFPGVPIRPAPMAFAEGAVTVPSWDRVGAPLAVTAHVYEFMDLDAPRTPPVLVDGVRVGGTYQPLLSTAGGLYRYALPDVTQCIGTLGALPLLRYVDKAEPVSLAGEALTSAEVQRALEAACAELSFELRFALCAPLGHRGYALYVESPGTGAALARLGEEVEARLCRHHAYWYCRRLGQLRPLQIFRVKDGARRYRATLRDQGLPEWELRATALDGRALWAEVFGHPQAA
jgi:hypothetical protein